MSLTKYLHLWMVDGKKFQGTNTTPFDGYKRRPERPSTILDMSDLGHKGVEEDERVGLDLDHCFPSLEPKVFYEREERAGCLESQAWVLVIVLPQMTSVMMGKTCSCRTAALAPVGQSCCHIPLGSVGRSAEVT